MELPALKRMRLWQKQTLSDTTEIIRVPNGWILNQWFEEDVADGRGSRMHYNSTFIPEWLPGPIK